MALGDNAAWQRRSLASVWHPCTQMQRAVQVPPLPIVRAQGPWLYDAEGARYFDANSSWWVNLFGHADPGIVAALQDQLQTLPHVMLAGCTHPPAVELAERLSALTQGRLGHVFYASDGASAVEIALKMSFHHWQNHGQSGKRRFVCLRQGYHGETLGALAVTDVQVFRDAYGPLLLTPLQVMSPDARQAQANEGPQEVAERAAQALERCLQDHHHEVAALIVEPLVQGATGMAMYHPHYLRRAHALCQRYGVHLIADEIAVGCGRTGTFFASEQAEVWPDFICLSKGITGGFLPLSLVLTTDAVYRAFLSDDVTRGFLHSHSYTGNPLACRAALAVLDRFGQQPVLADNARQAATLSAALQSLWQDPRIEHPRHLGMIWAFDVKPECVHGRFAERFHQIGRQHGLLIRPIGRTVYLLPPYLLTPEHSVWLAERLQATLHDTLSSPDSADADFSPQPVLA